MVAAARIGYTFGQDPAELLRDPSSTAWLVRNAALEVWTRDEKARNKASGSGAPHRRR